MNRRNFFCATVGFLVGSIIDKNLNVNLKNTIKDTVYYKHKIPYSEIAYDEKLSQISTQYFQNASEYIAQKVFPIV